MLDKLLQIILSVIINFIKEKIEDLQEMPVQALATGSFLDNFKDSIIERLKAELADFKGDLKEFLILHDIFDADRILLFVIARLKKIDRNPTDNTLDMIPFAPEALEKKILDMIITPMVALISKALIDLLDE